MAHSTELYFDKVNPQGYAETFDGDKILYNISKIAPDKYDEFSGYIFGEDGNGSAFLPAGRFITITTVSMDIRSMVMKVYDFKNEERFPKMMFSGDENLETIMGVFDLVRPNYNTDYDKFILVEGEIPHSQEKP
jgi:hypothetical protein